MQRLWTLLLALAALSPAVAADDKEDLKAAAKKLADAANYSWTTIVKLSGENQGAARMAPGPIDGKTEKDGVTWFSMKLGDTSFEGAMKGEKLAFKFQDLWMGSGDIPGGAQPGRPDPSMFASRMMKSMKPAAQNVSEAIDKLKDVKSEGDGVYSGEFTPEGAKDQLAPPNRGQGNFSPTVSDAKGSVKFWVKGGIIVKVESALQGKMMIGQREIEINRTATTDIKDVGSTKIELPEEAKKRLE